MATITGSDNDRNYFPPSREDGRSEMSRLEDRLGAPSQGPCDSSSLLPETTRITYTIEATEPGAPPSYEEAIDPSAAPPPTYESLFGRVKEVHKTSSGTIDFLKKLLILLAGTLGCTIMLGVTIIIPAAMFFIGFAYINDCPANDFIPLYLLIGGAGGLFKQSVHLSFSVKRAREQTTEAEDEQASSFHNTLACLMLMWFFAGTYWVYKEYTPSFDPNDKEHYCNKTVYWFAFWQVTMFYMLMGLVTCCLCSASVALVAFANQQARQENASPS